MGPGTPLDVPTGPAWELEIAVQRGPSAGSVFHVRRFPAVVGRGQDADVRLQDDPADPRLSRHHLRLDLAGGRIFLVDQSTNGTWQGERQLGPGESVPLAEGDPVWLGPHTMLTMRLRRSDAPFGRDTEAVRPTAPASGAVGPEGLEVPAPVSPAPPGPPGGAGGIGPVLRVEALGPFRASASGVLLADSAWETRKAVVLLVYLAEHWPRPVPVEQLEDALWPDGEASPRQALQTTVSRVRRAVRGAPPGFPVPVAHERDGYRLAPGLALDYDVGRFGDLLRRAREVPEAEGLLAEALGLWRGPFLQGFSEDWVVARRRTLDAQVLEAREALGARWEGQGRWAEAIRIYREVLAAEPCREPSLVALVRSLWSAGRRDEAVRRYHEGVATLERTLGLGPGEDLARLYHTLLRGE